MKKTLLLVLMFVAMSSISGCGLLGSNEPLYLNLAKTELRCLALNGSRVQFVVRTEVEYKALFSAHPLYDNEICKKLSLVPPVDLTQYTILGAYAQGSGCQSYQEHVIDRNDKKRTLSYFYELNTIGQCKQVIILPGWIAVKVIPDDYTISIRSEHRHTDRDQ
jgi:hypothetical protein